ncbi:EAL domain-containing protein [Actinotalea sp. K2]|uniref:EAL domain-containing protein n=1 Tax=Actinotalea sp. K2 TaxID=2939438 RepID=UPI002017C4CC|nr:EAL domain-containing protein [Actinotalea sp. K2]MCL3863133.1 EAL domain-containing protein [Actinotalea sp. K2]
MPTRPTWVGRVARRTGAVPVWLALLVLAALLAGSWLAVYSFGGSRSAMPHLFYVPIILATLPFGFRGATSTAVVAAVLCGPLMPLDTTTGESQSVSAWLVRGVMFVVVGAVTSGSLALRERRYELELHEEVRRTFAAGHPTLPAIDGDLVDLVDEVIDSRRFHPVFQPIYSLSGGHLVAVEALTRFDVEPYRTPDVWFAAAAAVGRREELETAAIEAALEAAGSLPSHVGLSVNASPEALADPRLVSMLTEWPHDLTVEITEHDVIEDYHLLTRELAALRAAGLKVAVDDAGAGFASLQHIVELAPDIIKLDLSLAQGLATSPLRRALAGSVIEFVRKAGAELVVEGIEELVDLSIWSTMGAHSVQGYLVGRPGQLPAPPTSAVIASLRGPAR